MGWLVPRLPTIRCLTSTFSFVLIWGGLPSEYFGFFIAESPAHRVRENSTFNIAQFRGDHRDAIITGIRLGDDFFDKVFLHEQSNLARDSPFR